MTTKEVLIFSQPRWRNGRKLQQRRQTTTVVAATLFFFGFHLSFKAFFFTNWSLSRGVDCG